MTKLISLAMARRRLTTLWFGVAGSLFTLLVGLSLAGKFEDKYVEAWGWFLPNIMPTLGLMVAVLAAAAGKRSQEKERVDRFFYRIAFYLSGFYLLQVGGVILVSPLVEDFAGPIELMQIASAWLGPLQGLVSLTLGVFFFKKKREQPAGEPEG